MDRPPRLKRYKGRTNGRHLKNVKWLRTSPRSSQAPRQKLSSILWQIGSNRTLIWTEWTTLGPKITTHTPNSLNMSSKDQLIPNLALCLSAIHSSKEILTSHHSRIRQALKIHLQTNMRPDIMKWAKNSHLQEVSIWTQQAISANCKIRVLPS